MSEASKTPETDAAEFEMRDYTSDGLSVRLEVIQSHVARSLELRLNEALDRAQRAEDQRDNAIRLQSSIQSQRERESSKIAELERQLAFLESVTPPDVWAESLRPALASSGQGERSSK